MTRRVRVARKGFKVAGFSVSCRSPVRVAGKGLREAGAGGTSGLRVNEWRVARINGRNLAASTRSLRAPGAECRLRGEECGLQEREGDEAEGVVGRNIKNGSRVLANCQLVCECTE